jgi:hypothetical protein
MKKANIEKAYNLLWDSFASTCRAHGYVAKTPNSGDCFTARQSGDFISVNALVYLKDWRYKAVSDAKAIDILIRSVERFDCAGVAMVKSTVQVVYLRQIDGHHKPLLALHYDFECPSSPAHPIFHVQLGESSFTSQECSSVGMQHIITKPEAHHYGNVRIPTPYMNFASVLLGLTADHLPKTGFHQFLAALRRNDAIKWDANCPALRDSLNSLKGYLHSHHWYE